MSGAQADGRSQSIAGPAEPGGFRLLFILAVLLGFASISTDLFLPALPTMQVALGTSEGTLQFAISGYLLGFGFGQLFWGPVSDRFGRRGPVALGIVIFVIGSAGCALSTDAWQLIGWRIVQALGASAGVALARAMVRDLYERDRAAKVLSTLMTVMVVAPLLGPSVGAQILAVSSWQAIFWTLVAIGTATALAILTVPETLPRAERHSDTIVQAVAGYGEVLRNRVLVGYAAAVGFYYVGVFANIAGGAFAYIAYHGLSPELYGLVFSSGVLGLMATNFINSRLVVRFGSDRMLLAGAVGAAAFGAALALVTATGIGGVVSLIVTQFLFTAMNGLILANAVAGALSSVQRRAGAASAVVGAIQYGSGMVGSALVGVLANGTPVPMGSVMALAGIGCLVSVVLARKIARSG
ncbi:multidrug effflux MFS transporter [Mesorhizobium sp. M0166]|uniref:multidrug effflux MFS transporter n=1 Tax=unclassified Mesorhizobium TaxID=325217 RepID=UPI00333CDCF6